MINILFILFYFIVDTSFAEDMPMTIIVEAHKDFEVYIAPTIIINNTQDVDDILGDYSTFGYASIHSRQAKVTNGFGGHHSIKASDSELKIFNEDTIRYAWDNCDYLSDPKLCSSTNDHFLLETHVTINSNQLVVAMYLFNPEMQIISQGVVTSNKTINWIKQQEAITNINQIRGIPQQQSTIISSCNENDSDCNPSQSIQNQSAYYREITTTKPKEELPLRWEIPHTLLDKQIQQASYRVWVGVLLE